MSCDTKNNKDVKDDSNIDIDKLDDFQININPSSGEKTVTTICL